MLYRQKFDTFIRIYDSIGFITNSGNFSDRVVNKTGAIFLSTICREPKAIDVFKDEISHFFTNIDLSVLEQDIIDFFAMLEDDGFIVSGKTEKELDEKDKRFSYSAIGLKTVKTDFTPIIQRAKRTTQIFLEEHFKDNPRLISFQIELTSRCNERCVHCYIPHKERNTDISSELFYDVLEQCRNMGLLHLTLSGGEPMLHPNFIDFLKKAKKYDFSINILSNITLLNQDIINAMKENRLSSVQVSLYSMNPEIHDAITKVPGSFIKTKENILRLIENDIPLQISCPTMKLNKNCYIDVINWAQENKIRAVTDYIMMARYDGTTDNLDERLNVDEVKVIIHDIINNDKEYQRVLASTDFSRIERLDVSKDRVCGACVSSFCMVANGNVYPCSGWQSYIVGNLYKQSLEDIWNNSQKVIYLRGLRKKDFPDCINCKDRAFCSMCMVRNANENIDNDPLKINKHFCNVAAVNREIVVDWKKRIKNKC